MLLVIALQIPASKLPHTLQPPLRPRREPNLQLAALDEDRTIMYRASTHTGAELLSFHPPNAIHIVRDSDVLFKLDWILGLCLFEHRKQLKRVLLCVNCDLGLYSNNRRPHNFSIFCSRTELLKYLAIDLYCHQHTTEAPDISDRVSHLFSFNSISGKQKQLFSIL